MFGDICRPVFVLKNIHTFFSCSDHFINVYIVNVVYIVVNVSEHFCVCSDVRCMVIFAMR